MYCSFCIQQYLHLHMIVHMFAHKSHTKAYYIMLSVNIHDIAYIKRYPKLVLNISEVVHYISKYLTIYLTTFPFYLSPLSLSLSLSLPLSLSLVWRALIPYKKAQIMYIDAGIYLLVKLKSYCEFYPRNILPFKSPHYCPIPCISADPFWGIGLVYLLFHGTVL